jgi:hypothetical protein
MNFIIYFLLICGLFIWRESFSYKDMTACLGNFLILQESLMGCNIIFKCDKNLLMFQNHFLKRISYLSWQYKEKNNNDI